MPVDWTQFEPEAPPETKGPDWSRFEPEKAQVLPLPTFQTPDYLDQTIPWAKRPEAPEGTSTRAAEALRAIPEIANKLQDVMLPGLTPRAQIRFLEPGLRKVHDALAPAISDFLRTSGIDPSSTEDHIINLPRISAEDFEKLPQQLFIGGPSFRVPKRGAQIQAGLQHLTASTAEGLAQPENAALVIATGGGGMVGRAASIIFASEQFAHLPDEIKEAISTIQDPKSTLEQKVEAAGKPGVNTLLATTMVHYGFRPFPQERGLPDFTRGRFPGSATVLPRQPLTLPPPGGGEPFIDVEAIPIEPTPPPSGPAGLLPPPSPGAPRAPRPTVPIRPAPGVTGREPIITPYTQPRELMTWNDFVEDFRSRGSGNETRTQIQALYPNLRLDRETAGELAKAAFGDKWTPGGQPRKVETRAPAETEISPPSAVPPVEGQPPDRQPEVETQVGAPQRGGEGEKGPDVLPQGEEVTLAPAGSVEQLHAGTPPITAGNVRIRIQMPDGSVIPALWNGYYEVPGTKFDGMPSLATLVKGAWSHGFRLPEGAKILDKIPTFEEWKAGKQAPTPAPVPPTPVPKPEPPVAGPTEELKQGDWVTYTDHYGKTHTGKISSVMRTGRIIPGGPILPPKTEYMMVDAEGNYLPSPKQGTVPVKSQEPSAPAPTPSEAEAPIPATLKAADEIFQLLQTGQPLTKAIAHDIMARHHGGTMAEGKFTAKDQSDVIELAVNRYINQNAEAFDPRMDNPDRARQTIQVLKMLMERLPTQTTRTVEQDKMQQFSTPPTEAFAANWVANLNPEDNMLEPSAGLAGLAVFSKNAGAHVTANELSPRRRAMLEQSGLVDDVHPHNAEHLHALLTPDINSGKARQPTVVVMNPPFSAGAVSGVKSTSIGARHVEEALKLLKPGGRLVAIVGEGMGDDKAHFKDWWRRIKGIYNVRANVKVSGEEYRKYGTTFDNNLIVIDKNGPTPEGGTVVGSVDKVEALVPLLESVRNDRPRPESGPAQPSGPPTPPAGTPPVRPPTPVPPPTGGVGPPRPAGPAGPGLGPTPQGPGGLQPQPQPPVVSPGVPAGPSQPPGGPAPPAEPPGGRPGEQPAPTPGVTISKPTGEREVSEIGVFSKYTPAKVHVEGTTPHPAPLVESSAMAAVEPVDPTYKPKIPKENLSALSDPQIEQVIYAGQSHQHELPTGERQGYFIGDGTGVGKGRELTGIFIDNWFQGRRKGMWVSAKKELIDAAKRDFKDVGLDPKHAINFMVNGGRGILGQKEGILFVTYKSLTMDYDGLLPGEPGQPPQLPAPSDPRKPSRIHMLQNWFGPDFDGVIAFDESHYAGNAIDVRGPRGIEEASARGRMVVDLQKLFPKARIVYASATGATDVTNLSYADRLGIWGPGTPFPSKAAFFNAISAGGLSAMEIVARDLKATGKYLSRTLSMEGVTHEKLEHVLTPDQVKLYDDLAKAWQLVQESRNMSMAQTGMSNNGFRRGQNNSKFWGASQRFWNQLMTAMEMPTVITKMEQSFAAGHADLLQLVNTNFATLNRELAKRGAEAEPGDSNWLEDLDLSPKDILLEYIDQHYPTQKFEQVMDDNGNVRWVPMEEDGRPVEDPEAVAKKLQLMDQIKLMKAPKNPIETILDHFGEEKFAEITGRGKRVVLKKMPDGTRKPVKENRTDAIRGVEYQDFNDDKRQGLIFSDKGGTGIDFHAGLKFKNQRLRDHFLIQAGWRADNVIQGLGRSNRTNQRQPPHQLLASTNLAGQRRFISTIMRRLSEMGSLTGGERLSAGRQLFSEDDDLENPYAEAAVHNFFVRLHRGEYPDLNFDELSRKLGFTYKVLDPHTGNIEDVNTLIDPDSGSLNLTKIPPIHMFLNRILQLEVSDQNNTFSTFDEIRRGIIETAKADGSYDPGTQKLRALEIRKTKDEVVYSDPRSTAKTRLVEIEHDQPVKVYPWDKINTVAPDRPVMQYVRNIRSQHVFALKEGPARTVSSGSVVDTWRRISPTGYDIVARGTVETEASYGRPANYEILTEEQAKPLWDAAAAKAPKVKTHKDTYLVGAMLPIWDRIGLQRPRIWRMTTNKGEILLGVHIPESQIEGIRDRLGAGGGEQPTPRIVYNRVMDEKASVELANGWVIKRSRVAGDYRIEVRNVQLNQSDEFTKYIGGYIERINFEPRFFIPTDEEPALEALSKILQKSPVVTRKPGGGGQPPGPPDPRQFRVAQMSGGAVAEPVWGSMRFYSGIPIPSTMAELQEFLYPFVQTAKAARVFWRGFSLKQAPMITDMDRLSGELGVRYAVAPYVARQHGLQFAGKVMAGITDPKFDQKLGTGISEDNLRDIRQRNLDLADEVRHRDEHIASAKEEIENFREAAREGDAYARQVIRNLRTRIDQLESYEDEDADRFETLAKGTFTFIGKPGSVFQTEAEYENFLSSSDAKSALDRHRNLWREQKDPLFRTANDLDPDINLETRGLQTDARINLKAVIEDSDFTKTTVGQRRSTLTKQTATLKRKDPFAIRAEGQGKAYESSYTELIAHGFEREFPIAAQHAFLKQLIESGTAALSDRESPPGFEIKGELTKGYLMKLRPWRGRFLQVPRSIAPEYEAITGLQPAARIPYFTRASEFLTRQSIVGLAEGSTHVANLLMEAFTGLGPTSNPLINALIKSIGRVDLLYTLPKVLIQGLQNQREAMLELATIGAAKEPYRGLMGKLLNWTDQGIRLNMDSLFSGMAEAGWVEDTETNRREFINQVGSYNKKLQPWLLRWLRDTHVQPFGTAMQTFNVMGLRRMVGAPGVEATSFRAALALKADIIAGFIGFLALLALVNYLVSGKPDGEKGTKLGAIGWTGEDGKLHQLDIGFLTGWTRGPRILGLQAAIEARRAGLSANTAMGAGLRAFGNTALSTVSGPGVQFATKVLTGARPGVPMVQEAPVVPPQDTFDPLRSQFAANVATALRQANPVVDSVVGVMNGRPGLEIANRQLSRYTPRTGMSTETIENLPKIVKNSEINAYADELAKQARKIPLAQRAPWIMERLENDELAPEVKARALIELRKRGAFLYP